MHRMKRLLAVSSLVLTLTAPAAASAASMDMMKPMVDDGKTDTVTKDGMELVALRPIAESLGYQVAWNTMDHSVTLTCTTMMNDGESDMTNPPMGDMSMTDKSMTDKSMTDKSMTDKSMTDKSMTDTSMTDKSMTDTSMMDKSMTDKSMTRVYSVNIMIGSKTATIDTMKTMLTDAPVVIGNKTYVTKAFVDMYLAGHAMMMK
ncbi:hypothetical protein [Cohnella zeiphila]|uniref:Copper amine oxidase-like N-terminal domain-containing protein n=1 Tax=Cohnella zeiphila TaxID=2761120 RepID=A0A7X0SLW6_9BACL|nr:hypothetical protein [Cohnella zeiphila]MBB6730143.1 hypothetical protein [Cohnella zeiphila]